MGNYKVYSEKEHKWITLPLCFQGEQGIQGVPGENGVTPLIKIVNGMWNVSYDDGRTWNEIGPSKGTSIDNVEAVVDASTGTPSATATYSGPDNSRTLTFRFSGLKGEQGPMGKDGAAGTPGKDGADGKDGKDGKDGMDGSAYEYIYFRGFSAEHKPNTPASGVGNNEDDFVPTEKQEVSVNGSIYELKWSDKAQGVDSIYMFEWRSERKKLDPTTWGDFTDPILWAKYGEKGKDGDGVQYIFKLTSGDTPDNPAPTDWETNSKYQNNEAEEFIPTGWDDDPQQVTEVNTHCWVSVRKYRNGKWGKYSDPTLWTKWVENASGVVADSIVVEMDPDMVMINEDDTQASTIIRAYRGNDIVDIHSIVCTSSEADVSIDEKNDKSWDIVVSNINSGSNIIDIKLEIYLTENSAPRYKTFKIYQTKFDVATATLDVDDDTILVPCADGINPDANIFPMTVSTTFRVNGTEQEGYTLSAEGYGEDIFTCVGGTINIHKFPGENKSVSVKFKATKGDAIAEAHIRFTKFDTKNGELTMYSLKLSANDIVCDTRGGNNVYTVYSGKQGQSDNIIKAIVSKYSSETGTKQISLAELPGNFKVYYANDPQDWKEGPDSTLWEYSELTDAGIEIGETISPDKCVSFQLREWIGEGEAWKDMTESNYKV